MTPFTSWISGLTPLLTSPRRREPGTRAWRGGRRGRRLLLEALEWRVVPSTLTVLNTDDSGSGSLRQAIQDAATGDTIEFSPAATGTISLSSRLAIDKDLAIRGPGRDRLAISGYYEGQGLGRVFTVAAGKSAAFSGLTIALGWAYDDLLASDGLPLGGGGIGFAGGSGASLTVTDCTFSDNHSGTYGGGISAIDAVLMVSNCVFQLNTSEGGGGIYVRSSSLGGSLATVGGCTFSGNGGGQGGGGGIYNLRGTLAVSNSTIAGNMASQFGGGIYNQDGSASVGNTTIAGNFASGNSYWSPGFGGGIYNLGGALTVSNSTIARNLIAGANQDGGGISNQSGTITIGNTILAQNKVWGFPEPRSDIYTPGAPVVSLGHNLVGYAHDIFVRGWVTSDLVGTRYWEPPIDPLLGELQDNGGPTPTLALLPGSPAIDAGDDANGGLPLPATDQRGRTRVAGAAIDIGAFEVHPSVFQADVEAIWAGTAGSTTITQAVDPGNIADYLNAVADLIPNPAAATTATIVLTSAGGVTPGQTIRVPAGVILVLDGVTFVGASPALTVTLGTVIVRNSTLTNATDAPTVRIVGGNLTLRGCTVQESTGYDQVAIRVEGGTLDLGTPADPGGNVINVNGAGQLLVNTTLYPVTMFGDTWQENGTTLAGSLLVTRGKAAGIGFWQSPNGRALINALGTTPAGVSRVGTWLAASYPNLYGSLSGGTPDGVWNHFRSLFKVTGTPKLEAQVMATALSAYVTDTTLNATSLGKSTAQRYGFVLGGGSLASEVAFVSGGQASSLGLAGGAGYYTVAQLLAVVDSQAPGGWLFSASADRTKRREANDLFAAINDSGGV